MNPPQLFGTPGAPLLGPHINRPRSKRKTIVPFAKKDPEHVWRRTLHALGVETVNQNMTSSTETSDPIEPPSSTNTSKQKLRIPDLPLEVQRNIFRQASCADLIALSLVSKHFRDRAAEQLCRVFHIVFPDDDDVSNDSTVDALAAGLDTFASSEYDYARHLREIVLETLSGGERGELAYKDYLYEGSCGKFMSSLLLLTLRKAKALETFKWDIRVELSRQVFKALHQIDSLQSLHLRMHSGLSTYQTPPGIGIVSLSYPPPPPPPPPQQLFIHAPLAPPQQHNVSSIATSTILSPTNSSTFAAGYKISQKEHQKQLNSILPGQNTPPTLSRFTGLKSLSILDIDSHEYIDELGLCIRSCSPDLKTLRLSFSESFAGKTRRPPPEVHSDDESDQEDEFGQTIPSPSILDPNGPGQALKAQEEKKRQEAVLGIILGWKPTPPRAQLDNQKPPVVEKEKRTLSEEDLKKRFIKSLVPVAARLMKKAKPENHDQVLESKELLELIQRSCQLYLDSSEKGKEGKATPKSEAEGSGTKETPKLLATTEEELTIIAAASVDGPGLFDEPKKKKKQSSDETGISDPDEIDVDEPEVEIEFDSGIETPITGSSKEDEVLVDKSEEEISQEAEHELKDTEDPNANLLTLENSNNTSRMLPLWHEEYSHNLNTLYAEVEKVRIAIDLLPATEVGNAGRDALEQKLAYIMHRLEYVEKLARTVVGSSEIPEVVKEEVKRYVRETRGLTLSTLEIDLIPMKANVLSQTIDLHALQSLTLLSVGPQVSLWNIMTANNNVKSLPLNKIHTDHVTPQFLVFVSQLEKVTELILLERASKQKGEPPAPKTTVTIAQIRKLVLKKHAATLKVLSLRNKTCPDWDLDTKTAMLLCRRAVNLEELGCIYGAKVMHTLLQFLPGLESLRVLHAYQLRDIDNCFFVSEGQRKFTVDIVAHNPHMKLEWIACGENLERLVRRKPVEKSRSKRKGKRAVDNNLSLLTGYAHDLLFPTSNTANTINWEKAMTHEFGDSPSSDDEDDGIFSKGLRIETVEGIQFYSVEGVRIFERSVLAGKL